MTNCNKTEKNINFPMPAVHFLTDSAHQRHLLAASNVLQAHLQAIVLLQYFMVLQPIFSYWYKDITDGSDFGQDYISLCYNYQPSTLTTTPLDICYYWFCKEQITFYDFGLGNWELLFTKKTYQTYRSTGIS